MKKPLRAALAVGCALTLAAGSALASSAITTKALQAQYMDIALKVNGQYIAPVDGSGAPAEPFAVDGTVYIPARTLGQILGKEVSWDGETNTVIVGESPFIEDAQQMVGNIESAHPAFLLDQVPAGYEQAKADFLAVAARPDVTLYEFSWAATAYAASMEDGHTALDGFGGAPQAALDVDWAVDGERLLLDGEAVTAVGGVPVADLFAVVDKYFTAENQSGRDVNRAGWSANQNVLYFAGAAISEDRGSTTVTVGGKDRTVAFVYPDYSGVDTTIATGRQMGDVYYVDLNQCILGDEVDAAAAGLAEAVKAGTHKVILDVRGNGGGNSEACYQFLQVLGMEIPEYGSYVRYSTLALDEVQDPFKPYPYERGYTKTEGGEQVDLPDLTTAKANPDFDLVVLTDEATYSSATMLGVWVQDGKLGKVIGRASANSPSSYGDILYYQLNNTGMFGTVSHIQWQRPDKDADPRTLVPDIETKPGEDALEAALAYFKGI